MNEARDLEMLFQESYEYTLKDWDEWEITLEVDCMDVFYGLSMAG